eukprot:CAMPEP_0196718308 /NCGR_PEP_ID=MMETSP1091-20130531/1535_1 /TAXON_ID=302021 /ORGANISM="Rhodomonas sp., Strain CCMP768" /LENGTH=410 /DNA_ID=CAMNT_0042058929 /DNA_START=65 /DNA_END=1297 /DNA_ORIENTATION=-
MMRSALLLVGIAASSGFLAPSPLSTSIISKSSSLSLGQQRRGVEPALGLRMGMRDGMAETKNKLKSKAKKAGIATLAAIGMLLGAPGEALAGASKSGGRAGGASFHRGPAPAAPAATGGAATATASKTAVAAPAAASGTVVVHHHHHSPGMFGGFSPFGFSPFVGFSPFGFSPFGYGFGPAMGFGVSATAALAVAGAAVVGVAGYSIYRGIEDRRLGIYNGISVAKIQVAVHCDSRGPTSLLGTVSRLAEGDTYSQAGVSSLISDTALALLRRESDWISASLDTKETPDPDQAEEFFGQMSLAERSKVERETVNRVNGMDRSQNREAESSLSSIGKPTTAIITLIVALEGRKFPEVHDIPTLRSALSQLGSDVIENEGLLAGEVLWTPEEAWETIMPEDVPLSYPKLVPL